MSFKYQLRRFKFRYCQRLCDKQIILSGGIWRLISEENSDVNDDDEDAAYCNNNSNSHELKLLNLQVETRV